MNLIFYFVLTNTLFYSFARSQINFWSFASSLQKHFISFIYPILDSILIFYSVFTKTWFHSFVRFQIEFWSSASLLRTFDFILTLCPRLNYELLLRFYKHLISFIRPVPDWISIFCFVITNSWFNSLNLILCFVLTNTWFIHLPSPILNFYLLLCYYERLISFFHSVLV